MNKPPVSECYRRVFQLYIFQSTATQPHLESIPWNLHTNLGIFVEWNICPHNTIKSKRGGLTKIMEPQSNFKKNGCNFGEIYPDQLWFYFIFVVAASALNKSI